MSGWYRDVEHIFSSANLHHFNLSDDILLKQTMKLTEII